MSTVDITNPRGVRGTRGEHVRALVALTKPRIIELLLVTTVPAMVLAAGAWPGTWLVIATLIGGTLSAGGANAINNFVDRDIDQVMGRTGHRPLPSKRVEPIVALWLGTALGVAGFVWLWATTNLLAGLIATAALAFYVFVYTLTLKRSTPQNIVIGGAAGAAPALVGWAAVSGTVGLAAWVLFAIIFFWTPPHFWALALRYRDDYERAGVPMLPVVAGERYTTNHMVLYSVVLLGVTLLLFPAAPMSRFYLAVSAVLGGAFVWGAWQVRRRPENAMRFFRFSITYLALLSGAVAIDPLVF